jgi:hypothetical protein
MKNQKTLSHISTHRIQTHRLQIAFEGEVGEKWLEYAYTIEYKLARDIVRLAFTGISSNNDYDNADRIVGERNVLTSLGRG